MVIKQSILLSILLIIVPGIVNITVAKVTSSVDCPGPACPSVQVDCPDPACPGRGPFIMADNIVIFPSVEGLTDENMSNIFFHENATSKTRVIRGPNSSVVSIILPFSSHSVELSKANMEILNRIGNLMTKKIFISYALLIEGHAENQQISIKRAEVVKDYLIVFSKINPNRLHIFERSGDETTGPENQKSSQNQSVQIKVLFPKENHTESTDD